MMEPGDWIYRKLAHAYYKIGSGTTPRSDNAEYYDDEDGTPWVTTSELRETYIENTGVHVTDAALEDHSALQVYEPGSLMIAMYGATIGRLGIITVNAACNQACCVFERSELIDNRYLFYWLLHRRDDLISLSVGGGQPNLSQGLLKAERALCPPLEVQRKIAGYLDMRCDEIDDLIAKKRGLLKLLAEKRSALITRAVTKGLDPNAAMKPSGIDWLGDIPAHWNASYRLKFLTTVSGGLTPLTSNANYWRGEVPWVSPKDMKVFDIADSEDKVTELALEETSLSLIPPDAVLFVVRGMILAHTFPIAINSVPVTVNQDMKALRCDDRLVPRFLAYLLRGIDRHVLSLIETSAHGTKALRTESWRELNVPMPSLDEQQEIIRAIDAGILDIDKSAGLVQRAISRLTEYRSAIITKAVTGELEVA